MENLTKQILLGCFLGFINLIIYADQIYLIKQNKRSQLTLVALILTLIGEFLWLVYGFNVKKPALVIDKIVVVILTVILAYYSVIYQIEEEDDEELDQQNFRNGVMLSVFGTFGIIFFIFYMNDKSLFKKLLRGFGEKNERISLIAVIFLLAAYIAAVFSSSSTEGYNLWSLFFLITLAIIWIIYSIYQKHMPTLFMDKLLTLVAYFGILIIKLYNFYTGKDKCGGTLFGKLEIGKCESSPSSSGS